MRRILGASLLLILTSSYCVAQAILYDQAETENVKEVLRIEDERTHAVLNGDADALERIYSDDFAYTNESGETPTKAQFINNFRTGNRKFLKYVHDDIHIHEYGNTVVLNGRSTSTYLYKGETFNAPRRFTLVYVKQDGQWHVVALHVSTVPKN